MKLYVSTYAKYNAGSLFGKWMDLNDYADHDDFIEACKELHKDETDHEFMFQDFEGFPDIFYCECDASLAFEYKEALADSGMSKADIAEAVGMPRTVIVSLSNDMMQHSEKFDQAYALLDLWHRLHQNTKPLPEIK